MLDDRRTLIERFVRADAAAVGQLDGHPWFRQVRELMRRVTSGLRTRKGRRRGLSSGISGFQYPNLEFPARNARTGPGCRVEEPQERSRRRQKNVREFLVGT